MLDRLRHLLSQGEAEHVAFKPKRGRDAPGVLTQITPLHSARFQVLRPKRTWKAWSGQQMAPMPMLLVLERRWESLPRKYFVTR